MTVNTWFHNLRAFPIGILKQAADKYIHLGKSFFPTLPEILNLADDVWRQQIESQRAENTQAEREATKLLFHKPLNGFVDDYVKKSVALIRKACNGEIKFMSAEWKSEFEAIYGKNYSPERVIGGYYGRTCD